MVRKQRTSDVSNRKLVLMDRHVILGGAFLCRTRRGGCAGEQVHMPTFLCLGNRREDQARVIGFRVGFTAPSAAAQ